MIDLRRQGPTSRSHDPWVADVTVRRASGSTITSPAAPYTPRPRCLVERRLANCVGKFDKRRATEDRTGRTIFQKAKKPWNSAFAWAEVV